MHKKLVWLTLSLIVITFISLWLTQERLPAPASGSQGEALIGGPFALTDQDGRAVTDETFRGRLMLVFFGFTRCPDICPGTLASLSQAMEMLGDEAGYVAPVFITVDPGRDTPAAMKAYLANFDSRVAGLTGTPEQIEKALAAYKAYAAEEHGHDEHGAHGSENAPMFNHSGYIYLMDAQGKYLRHFAHNAPPQEIADAVRAVLRPE